MSAESTESAIATGVTDWRRRSPSWVCKGARVVLVKVEAPLNGKGIEIALIGGSITDGPLTYEDSPCLLARLDEHYNYDLFPTPTNGHLMLLRLQTPCLLTMDEVVALRDETRAFGWFDGCYPADEIRRIMKGFQSWSAESRLLKILPS